MPRTRANSEGTLYQRKDGRYEGATRLRMASGKKKRVSVYGKTREEAHRKLVQLIEQSYRGILPSERPYRLNEYLDFLVETREAPAADAQTT